ncbi:MAG: hypothetical protein OXQ92_11875 [Boseongicola sp.]|nr:hypothetical protein [Boseongicola sp.]MDD9979105.1 hypothetical protein [Boseongicola sp.]
MDTNQRVATWDRSRVTGPGASALKYDILTALLSMASREQGARARLALRLSLLITARFNWRSATFAVGQREMARMWNVTERTAKREIAAMRAIGWVSVSSPAARGRVAQYRLELGRLMGDTETHWSAIGPDYNARMSGHSEPVQESTTNVVPLSVPPTTAPPDDGSTWSKAATDLHRNDPATFNAWLSNLVPIEGRDHQIVLAAPSKFIADYVDTHFKARLLAAVSHHDRSIRELRIVAP